MNPIYGLVNLSNASGTASFFPAVFPATVGFFPLAPFLSGQSEGKNWEGGDFGVILQRLPNWEMRSLVSWFACRGNFTVDVAGTLHSTSFASKHLIVRQIRNVGCLSTLHSPYIFPT